MPSPCLVERLPFHMLPPPRDSLGNVRLGSVADGGVYFRLVEIHTQHERTETAHQSLGWSPSSKERGLEQAVHCYRFQFVEALRAPKQQHRSPIEQPESCRERA